MSVYIESFPPKEYLRRYLKVAPLALAIFRSIEATHISSVSMKRPVLDLGCGFGEFAGVFFNRQVEMGLDVSWRELLAANKSKRYKNLTCVDARHMEFKDNTFATVLSVSVLEHIPKADEVVREVFRVLKPGGQFVLTANSSAIDKYLYWPAVLKRIGLASLGAAYTRKYHRIFRHTTLWTKDRWIHTLRESGFIVTTAREIISPEATAFFDLMLITSWPSQIIKMITGKRWAWRPTWFREWLIRQYGWFVQTDSKEGSNIFIVAKKPEASIKKKHKYNIHKYA